MKKHTVSIDYDLKWRLNFDDKYRWSTCGKLFNMRTGREIKKTVNGYSAGYWIGRKFYTLKNLRKHLEIIKEVDCPF